MESRDIAITFITGLQYKQDRKWVVVAVHSSKDFMIQGTMVPLKIVY
jgi:hypothetical protein